MKKRSITAIAALTAVCMTISMIPAAYAAETSAQAPSAVSSVRDGQMIISEGGTYTLRGRMNGTVFIDTAEDVTLVFDGVSINGGNAPAVVKEKGSLAIKAQGNNTIRGKNGKYDGVISCGEDLTVEKGKFTIYGDKNGIAAKSLILSGGTVKVAAKRTVSLKTKVVEDGGKIILIDDNTKTPELGTVLGTAVSSSQPSYADGMAQTSASAVSTDTQAETAAADEAKPAEVPDQSYNKTEQDNFVPPERTDETAPEQMGEFDPAQAGDFAPGQTGGFDPAQGDGQTNTQTAESTVSQATTIAEGTTSNSAMTLAADTDNTVTYTITDDDSDVTISSSGTYIVTGSASDGSVTVKKGTTGVVLILEDLDLTSTTGAALSINKNAEVQVIISGTVSLTDNEDPADETFSDEAVADAFDGAAIKVKAGAVTFITGDGTLNISGNAKNGIKGGDESSIIIGGDVTVNITAANDGINGSYDVTILDGTVNISAGDDAVHADRILTVGSDDGTGPDINIASCEEGLEGTVVNIRGGNITINSNDDAVNAANSDGTYSDTLDFSINQTGGTVTINAGGDGYDSNGNINLINGSASITSANMGGEAGIDYDGSLYISDSFVLNNGSGVAGADGAPPMGGMNGQPGAVGGRPGGMF